MNTIRIRITKRCYVSRDKVGEIGDVVELDVPQAANLLGFGGGVAVDPEAAREAIKAWNASAIRAEVQSQPRAPQPLSWIAGGRYN